MFQTILTQSQFIPMIQRKLCILEEFIVKHKAQPVQEENHTGFMLLGLARLQLSVYIHKIMMANHFRVSYIVILLVQNTWLITNTSSLTFEIVGGFKTPGTLQLPKGELIYYDSNREYHNITATINGESRLHLQCNAIDLFFKMEDQNILTP